MSKREPWEIIKIFPPMPRLDSQATANKVEVGVSRKPYRLQYLIKREIKRQLAAMPWHHVSYFVRPERRFRREAWNWMGLTGDRWVSWPVQTQIEEFTEIPILQEGHVERLLRLHVRSLVYGERYE